MSLLQDYYPAIRDGKEVYIRIDLLTEDDVFADCNLMLDAAAKFAEKAEFDAAYQLMEHAEQLRNYVRNPRAELQRVSTVKSGGTG